MLRPDKHCDTCKYDAFGPLCDNAQCEDCPLFMREPGRNTIGRRVHCKCLTVKDGEECPYYEEAASVDCDGRCLNCDNYDTSDCPDRR